MQKAYNPIIWKNYPSERTPLNEENLNKMDSAIEVIDNRVVSQYVTKANVADVLTMISDVSFDEKTGIFTITRKNGSSFTIDTKLEKLSINWQYDADKEMIIITLEDGTTQEVSLSSLITEYNFSETDTVSFTVVNGKVTAIVKEGSIEEKHLRPNYLANIKTEVSKATTHATSAAESATQSANSALDAKTYAEAAAESASMAESIVGVQVTGVKGSAESSFRKGNVVITPENIGLGNVPNVTTNDQTPTYSAATNNSTLTSGEKLSVAFGKIAKAISSLINHLANVSNPHSVTKAQVGLDKVENTADSEKSVLSASKLTTARNISLTGDVTGSVSFDGSGHASIATTITDDSHNHIISNVDGLQAALNGKSDTSHTHTTLSGLTATVAELNFMDGVTSNVQTQLSGKAPSSHNQAASTITAGTLAGVVVANATSVATLGTKQVRNIYAGTAELTAGTSALPTGDIYIQYE